MLFSLRKYRERMIDIAIIDTVMELAGINDTSKDAFINFHIQAVTQKIKNYCSRDDLPTALEFIVIELTLNRLKGTQNNLKAVTRGDTTFQYATSDATLGHELKPYENELSRYRKVVIP